MNFCHPLGKVFPSQFRDASSVPHVSLLPEASTAPNTLQAPLGVDCPIQIVDSPHPARKLRAGQCHFSQPWPTTTAGKLRHAVQPGSECQPIDWCPPTLDFLKSSKRALCQQCDSVCVFVYVCVCMSGFMQMSCPKAPCLYRVCFGDVPLHKYRKSPVDLFYFIFEHC